MNGCKKLKEVNRWFAFIVLESAIQAADGEKTSMVLSGQTLHAGALTCTTNSVTVARLLLGGE